MAYVHSKKKERLNAQRYKMTGRAEIGRACRLPYSDPDYQPPTPNEIRVALEEFGLTGAIAGKLLGVTDRTVRKWTGGDQSIPYSTWRLLLVEMGIALKGRPSSAVAEKSATYNAGRE